MNSEEEILKEIKKLQEKYFYWFEKFRPIFNTF